MCGRYSRFLPDESLARHFNLKDKISLQPRYNIGPGQDVPVVKLGADGDRELVFLRWGLIPPWADDDKFGFKAVNARSETIDEKPAFRNAFKSKRVLIPCDGFYEWAKKGKKKTPYFIYLKNSETFALAGLRESWTGRDGEGGKITINSCTIITTAANELIAPLHDRMPVIVSPENYGMWLDASYAGTENIKKMLAPTPSEKMELRQVSDYVNNTRNEGVECIQPRYEEQMRLI